MSERKLASIQKIIDIQPIPDADKIQVATVLGWQCVIAKKDNFKVGDMVVFIEIDSIVPERNEFEFLRERKFRVRTIKLRKQVSQGLIMPLTILPNSARTFSSIIEGADVTEVLGIKKYNPELAEEQKMSFNEMKKNKFLRFFMNFAIFRWIYFKLNHVDKGWPHWIQKTDEERIQTCAKLFMNNMDKLWYVTEKLDGQSGTYFYHKSKKWGLPHWIFGICSRNIWLKKSTNGSYWKMAEKYDLKNKFAKFNRELICQGENIGVGIQKNKYGLEDIDLRVFTLKKDGVNCSVSEMEYNCELLGLKTVPVIYRAFDPKSLGNIAEVKDVVQALVKMSDGKSQLADVPREGLVFRLIENPNISFKVINPNFLLLHGE
ncbi:MAG: RNA ligase family protein [Atribacterota bacterium]|nr:RNA ligase family protein [Atribacterota bacterium]